MKYEPNIPDFNKLFDNEEIRKCAEDSMSEVNQAGYEESILKEQADDISRQVTDKMERQIVAIEKIANSANEIADSAREQAESARTIAEKADETSASAQKKSDKSFVVSVLALVSTLVINADKIWHNIQSALSYLHTLSGSK